MRTRLLLAALLASGGAAPAFAEPPLISPELQPYVARNIRAYFVGLLVAPAQPHPMSRELFIRHQNYMRGRFEAGVYRLAGRFSDDSRIAGMVILSAPDAEAARAIVAADPAVAEGALAVEIHPAIFPDLSGLRVEYPPRPAH